MCGISGIYKIRETVNNKDLELNNCNMLHRGPDSSGTWISKDGKLGLSQVRLSIVDLDRRSNQPMQIDEKLTLVFNGEIYNYLTLKEELSKKYTFKTESDTEVLGFLYKEHGKNMLNKIEGMFAFAIYDSEKDELFIARDFVGQKPVVYFQDTTGFYFSSEIPVLFPYLKKRDIDTEAIGVFLTSNFNHIPAPFTVFKNIKKLEPSHYMRIKKGKIIEKKQYYKLLKKNISQKNEAELIFKKINYMKPKDVSYSSFLSGGNDSALVCLGLRNNYGGNIDAYTFKLSEKDIDFVRSKYVAKKLSLNHKIVDFDNPSFLKKINEQIQKYGEPYFHITSVYSDTLLGEVKKKHKVIFTGAGGDELYYGYNNALFLKISLFLYMKRFLPAYIQKVILPKNQHFVINADLKTFKYKYYLNEFNKVNKLLSKKPKKIKTYFKKLNEYIFSQAEIKNYMDLTYMAGLFVENAHSLTIQSDLIGMKNSVEVRCPFLEKQLIEQSYNMPLMQKLSLFNLSEGKKVLKNILKKTFSEDFVYGKKVGFGTEINKYDYILNEHYENIYKQILYLKNKGFNEKELRMIVGSKSLMKKNFTISMKLYSLSVWFKKFGGSNYEHSKRAHS